MLLPLLFCLCILMPPARAAEDAGIHVALIDTGLSDSVISQESIAEGKNYARPGYDTADTVGHGTAVAQLILQQAPDITIVPLVWCATLNGRDLISCDLDTVAQMIRDAVDIYDCRVINLSAATSANHPALREALAYAEKEGAVVVAAAGNDNQSERERIYYPAAYETVIGVGALLKNGSVAPFSQRTGVSLAAPGDNLSVTKPDGKMTKVSGTSYACAFVAAAAAQLLEQNPTLTPAQVREALYCTALDVGEPGFDSGTGWGKVQPEATLKYPSDRLFPFADLEETDYFIKPVCWAMEQYLRQTSLTGGIPFAVSLPKAPYVLNADKMTAAELHAAPKAGYDDIEAGNVRDASSAFSAFRGSHR